MISSLEQVHLGAVLIGGGRAGDQPAPAARWWGSHQAWARRCVACGGTGRFGVVTWPTLISKLDV
jgi:hypothetical protein